MKKHLLLLAFALLAILLLACQLGGGDELQATPTPAPPAPAWTPSTPSRPRAWRPTVLPIRSGWPAGPNWPLCHPRSCHE